MPMKASFSHNPQALPLTPDPSRPATSRPPLTTINVNTRTDGYNIGSNVWQVPGLTWEKVGVKQVTSVPAAKKTTEILACWLRNKLGVQNITVKYTSSPLHRTYTQTHLSFLPSSGLWQLTWITLFFLETLPMTLRFVGHA